MVFVSCLNLSVSITKLTVTLFWDTQICSFWLKLEVHVTDKMAKQSFLCHGFGHIAQWAFIIIHFNKFFWSIQIMDSPSSSLKCGQLLAGASPPDYGVFCNSEEFSDLKLTVGETTYFGHRIVLATASEVFQTMLSSVSGH